LSEAAIEAHRAAHEMGDGELRGEAERLAYLLKFVRLFFGGIETFLQIEPSALQAFLRFAEGSAEEANPRLARPSPGLSERARGHQGQACLTPATCSRAWLAARAMISVLRPRSWARISRRRNSRRPSASSAVASVMIALRCSAVSGPRVFS